MFFIEIKKPCYFILNQNIKQVINTQLFINLIWVMENVSYFWNRFAF